MAVVTTHSRRTGKDFPGPRRRGKKCRPVLLRMGVCVALLMLAGGLGMADVSHHGADQGAMGAANPAAVRATIVFAAQAVVAGPDVRLGDVADVRADDEQLREKLTGLVIGPAPHVGQVLTFRGDGVRLLLRRDRRKLALDDSNVEVSGANVTRIVAESQTIEPDVLLDHLRPWVADKAAAAYAARSVEVVYATPQPAITVPKGEWDAMPRLARLPRRLPTVLSLPVAIRVDGRNAATVTLALNLQIHGTVAVATRAAGRHEALGDADVEFVDVDLQTVNGCPVASNADQLLGLRTTRDIQAGEALTDANCELMPVVEKGDQVMVLLEAQHLRLTTVGEAQKDGRSGDFIEVRNLRSDRIFRGTVIGRRVVRVTIPELQVGASRETALAR